MSMLSLTDDERRAIRVRAASTYRRVAAFVARGEAGTEVEITPEAGIALQTWNQVFSPGDREAFVRRLAWDDLDGQTVARALSDDRGVAEELEPDWTIWLDLILEQAGSLVEELELGPPLEAGYFEPDEEPPFIELAAAALRAARRFLLEADPDVFARFSDPARLALERQLLKEVSGFSERTVYDLFRQLMTSRPDATSGEEVTGGDEHNAHDDHYRAFVISLLDDDLAPFFVAYPVLGRVIALLMERWVAATGELARRLEADRTAITDLFGGGVELGSVAAVSPALSDPHNERRRVAALTFDSGLHLIYKPRDVGIEWALTEFLHWANENGLNPAQGTLRVLRRSDYGWIEFAHQSAFASREAVSRYYRQAGGLVAITYLLRATDLHMENVVATEAGPVLVDPESLLQPLRRGEQDSTAGSTDPCVATGLVTFSETGADGERYENGGLRGEGARGSARPRRAWKDLRTDSLRFVDEHEFHRPSANRVLLDGVVQRPDAYRDDLFSGFADTYRFFTERQHEVTRDDGPLAAFAGGRVRIMFRPTNQYAVVQDVLAAPRYQSSGVARSSGLDVLARPFAADRARPASWPVFIEERRAVDRLDIPHFTVSADEVNLRAGHRRIEGRFFATPGLAVARKRIPALSGDDLSIQLEWLSRSLAESATSRFHARLAIDTSGQEVVATTAATSRAAAVDGTVLASWIGREFLDRAVSGGDALTWPFQTPGSPLRGAAAHYLDSGSLGPPLFLAALANITGDSAWADAARRAAEPARAFVSTLDPHAWPADLPLGIGSGFGSLVFGLTWIGKLLGDPLFIASAARVAFALQRERIRQDLDHDVLSGSAGAILALLALQNEVGGAFVDLAAACGDHLLASQLHTHWGSAWASRDGRLLAGFAHGAAGIAYALARLHRATGERSYLDAVLRAHRYERAVFSPVSRNWPLIRSAGHLPGNVAVQMTAWCHGAPGVALARSLVRDVVLDEDPEVNADIDVALETTAKLAGNAGDHLCCGNMGRSDVLLTAGRHLERRETVEAAKTIAADVERRAIRRGAFRFVSPNYEYVVFHPGFFHGLAGVGYQFLRLGAPSRLPSILAFEDSVAAPGGTAHS